MRRRSLKGFGCAYDHDGDPDHDDWAEHSYHHRIGPVSRGFAVREISIGPFLLLDGHPCLRMGDPLGDLANCRPFLGRALGGPAR